MIISRSAELLQRITWLSTDSSFRNPENINKKEWDYLGGLIDDGYYTDEQVTIINLFAFLVGKPLADVKCSEINKLSLEEKDACIQALSVHWRRVELQENLEY